MSDGLDHSKIIKDAEVGIWSYSIIKDCFEIDNAMASLLNISTRKFPSNLNTFLEIIHPDDRVIIKKIMIHPPKKETFSASFKLGKKYIALKGNIHFNKKDQPTKITGVCFDMTQNKTLEKKLRDDCEHAHDAVHSKTEFFARIIHDLRTPLNGIIGFAELMFHGKVGPISDDHKEYLGDILTSARHLQVLVNDVLDLAKLDSGKMDFHPSNIAPQNLLNETKHVFQTTINNKNIHFETIADKTLERIYIDPHKLKQVIYNYVSNALKVTPENGHVSVSIKPHNKDTFCLEVKDDGIGIKQEDFKRLFIEFQQLNHQIARQYPSSGLGLALTKKIVEAQGGKVDVKSTFGKGSSFYAYLPIHYTDKRE